MKPVAVLSRRTLIQTSLSLLPAACLIGQDEQKPSFSTEVKVVSVFATVRDKDGKIATDLVKDDFVLEEDGRTQTIRYFSKQSDLPLTLGLLVDTSASERRMLSEERTASEKFFEHVLRADHDKAFLIHFDHEVELLQDLTSSRERLEKALALLQTREPDQARSSGGGGAPSRATTEVGEAVAAAGAGVVRGVLVADRIPILVIGAERLFTTQFSSHPTNSCRNRTDGKPLSC